MSGDMSKTGVYLSSFALATHASSALADSVLSRSSEPYSVAWEATRHVWFSFEKNRVQPMAAMRIGIVSIFKTLVVDDRGAHLYGVTRSVSLYRSELGLRVTGPGSQHWFASQFGIPRKIRVLSHSPYIRTVTRSPRSQFSPSLGPLPSFLRFHPQCQAHFYLPHVPSLTRSVRTSYAQRAKSNRFSARPRFLLVSIAPLPLHFPHPIPQSVLDPAASHGRCYWYKCRPLRPPTNPRCHPLRVSACTRPHPHYPRRG
ncbi:hypothetical protein C8R45DRAFT_1040507 [Mycena sanguinolenta]|nr:hypothetical protein C8R45DRAFT_1040507 [Mycena sanguinolenta]